MRTFAVAAVLMILVSCTRGQTGLRLEIVNHAETSGRPFPAQPTNLTSTVYVSGPNHRVERVQQWYRGVSWHIVHIARCAEQVDYEVNLDTHEYIESARSTKESQAIKKAAAGKANVVFDVTTVDTGETKTVFGHKAHHYVTTTKQTEAPELGGAPSETTEDYWLLDVPDALTCPPGTHRPHGVIGGTVGYGGATAPVIRPEFHYSGPDPQGLAISTKRTTVHHEKYVYGEPHDVTSTFTTEVMDLKAVPVDPALFTVPRDFKKVTTFTPPGKTQ